MMLFATRRHFFFARERCDTDPYHWGIRRYSHRFCSVSRKAVSKMVIAAGFETRFGSGRHNLVSHHRRRQMSQTRRHSSSSNQRLRTGLVLRLASAHTARRLVFVITKFGQIYHIKERGHIRVLCALCLGHFWINFHFQVTKRSRHFDNRNTLYHHIQIIVLSPAWRQKLHFVEIFYYFRIAED